MRSFKTFWGALLGILAVCFIIAAVPPPITSSRDSLISNTNDSVGSQIQKSSTQSNDFEVFRAGSTVKWRVPATGIISVTNGGTGANKATNAQRSLGIQWGLISLPNASSVTQAFPVAYSALPAVCLTTTSSNACWVTNVTTTNFMALCIATNQTFQWHAIGPP